MSTTSDKAATPHPMPMEFRIAAMWEDAEYEWGEACGGPPAWELLAHKIISAMRQDFEAAEAAEQAFESVPLPRSVNMARMMLALGHRYLSEHAPEHLAKREASTEPSAVILRLFKEFSGDTGDGSEDGHMFSAGKAAGVLAVKRALGLTGAAGALTADAKDTARWRAFVGSARIKPQGSAGLGEPMPNNYAHMGLEIWTTHDRDYSQKLLDQMDASTALGREWLTKYADIAVAAIEAQAKAQEKGE